MDFQAYTIAHRPEWACLHVKAPDAPNRTPVHLCCVIDTSASMRQDHKLEYVKNSLHYLLDFLGPHDRLSLVTFSSQAQTLLRQLLVTEAEKENIRAHISIMRDENNTNLSAGIVEARGTLLAEGDGAGVKQGILILTDGHANVGITRPEHLLDIVRNTVQMFPGTSISCIGYGTDHNVELIQQISAVGGGPYYIVNNLDDVATVFGDVLGGLASCSFQQLRVLLPPRTELKSRYAVRSTKEEVEVSIGDLPAGMSAVFLARIPTGTVAVMKGFHLGNQSQVEIAAHVVATDDAERQTNGEAHYLRFEVLAVLDQAKGLLHPDANEDEVAAVKGRITSLIQNITEYRQQHPHSLWDVLVEELKTSRRHLEHRGRGAPGTPQIMSQHASYLGLMRGISASSAVPASAFASDQDNVPVPPVYHAAFSNQIQREISSQLYDAVSASQMTVDTSVIPGESQDPGSAPPHPSLYRERTYQAPSTPLALRRS